MSAPARPNTCACGREATPGGPAADPSIGREAYYGFALGAQQGWCTGTGWRSHQAAGPSERLVANPLAALLLDVGGMAALYATPLYRLTTADPVAHQLVHVHFLAAGCLFAWVIAGPDPAPRRPSVPIRLVVLGVAVATHSTVAQLLLAFALVSSWRPTRARTVRSPAALGRLRSRA